MLSITKQIFSPLLSLFILILGSGLFTTLIAVRLHHEGASSLVIGVMTSAYYAGFVSASFRTERFIVRVGHIRAFSAFASILAIVSLIQGLIVIPWFWILLRFLGGFATAGLFVVIESWLLALGTIKTRGRILALYMLVLYAGQATGQFLINVGTINSLLLFALTSMLSSLAVIPLAMTKVSSPQLSAPSTLSFKKLYEVSGSGVIGCFCSGLILGAIYGLLPLFIIQKTGQTSQVGLFMALTIFGGMALQYPVGKLSDHIERRTVLIGISMLTAVISLLTLSSFNQFWFATVIIFVFGGLTFTLYPVSISHACDSLNSEDIISGTQGLLLAYSIGAMLGPFIAPFFIHNLGSNGLFVYFIVISTGLACFLLFRRIRVAPKVQEEAFIVVPHTTPVTAELDPRSEETNT